jgi:hypothetical protein
VIVINSNDHASSSPDGNAGNEAAARKGNEFQV